VLFLRYKAQNERMYRRAVDEFNRLKALRPNYETNHFDFHPKKRTSLYPTRRTGFQTRWAGDSPAESPDATPNNPSNAE